MHVTTKRGRTNASHENDKELRLGPEGVKDELELRADIPGEQDIIGQGEPSPGGTRRRRTRTGTGGMETNKEYDVI